MVNDIVDQIKWIAKDEGASAEEIERTEAKIGARFTQEYRQFLARMNGANGRTPRGENMCFFGTRDLPQINDAASLAEFLPEWFIFASDLGGRSYLLRRSGDSGIVVSCFDEEFGEGALSREADDLASFLRRLI